MKSECVWRWARSPGKSYRLVLGLIAPSAGLRPGRRPGSRPGGGRLKRLASILPGIRPADPLAYAGVILLLPVAVALASAGPARRAIRIDPISALRWSNRAAQRLPSH